MGPPARPAAPERRHPPPRRVPPATSAVPARLAPGAPRRSRPRRVPPRGTAAAHHLLAEQGQRRVQVGRLGGPRRAPAAAAQLVLDTGLLRVQPLQVPPAPALAAAAGGGGVEQPAQALGQRRQPRAAAGPQQPRPAHAAAAASDGKSRVGRAAGGAARSPPRLRAAEGSGAPRGAADGPRGGAGRGRAARRCSRRTPGFVCGGAGPCPGGMAPRRPPAACCLPPALAHSGRVPVVSASCAPFISHLLSLPLHNRVVRSRWLKVGSYRPNRGWFVQFSIGRSNEIRWFLTLEVRLHVVSGFVYSLTWLFHDFNLIRLAGNYLKPAYS